MAATYQSSTTGFTTSNSPQAVANKPTGTAAGDLLLAIHIADFDGDLASMTDPSGGFTLLGSRAGTTSRECDVKVWGKIAGGSEPASYTFNDSTNAEAALAILRVSGADTALANISVVFGSGAASTSHVAPTNANGVTDGLLVTLHCADVNGNARTYTGHPAGMTNVTSPSGVGDDFAYMDVNVLALTSTGATGTKTATFSASNRYVTASIVIPPGGPTTKDGSDSGTGSESGTESVTSTSGESTTGAESGSVALPGDDSGTGSEGGYVAESRDGGDTSDGTETYDHSATVTSGESTTGAESGDTVAGIAPPADEAVGSFDGTITIPGEDEADGLDGHDEPTLVTVTTGEGGTGAEGGYVETLYGDLIVNLYAVDPDTGALTALPDYVSLDLSREANAKGALSLTYPVEGKGFDLLRGAITSDRDVEVELWTNGTPVGALRGYLQEASGDDVAEEQVWDFAGSWLEVRADEAVVFPQSLGSQIVDPDTGDLVWTNPKRELIVNADSPGELVTLLLDQAQDRGALTDISADFTTTHDSNGTPWGGVLTAKFSPGSTYTQILDRLVSLNLAEWAIVWDSTAQQKVLKLWNPEGRGADLTLGPRPVTLRRGRNLLDAPRKWSVRESATTVLAAGAEGLYDDETDATALARRDRRIETYATLQNAADDEALLAFAQAELALRTPGLLEVAHGVGMLPGEPRPVIAFDVADWVYSQTGTEVERLRVVQWTLTIDDQRQLSGTVTLNDVVTDQLVRLQRQLNAISSGEAVVGTSEPGPQVEDRTPPAAPQGVVASSIAYQDPQQGLGQTLAFVTVGWNPVTTNADGSDSPLVQAAVFILDKIEDEIANPPDPEDPDYAPFDPATWTWKECPQIVQDFAAEVRALWVEDSSPTPETDWLTDYIAEASQTPTAAQDIAGYRVRYSYLGIAQVGGLPSSDPFPEEERFYYQATPPEGTAGNEYSFGGVEGGSRLRIEVCAFDRVGNQGPWATIAHDSSNDATPPPVPSTPTIKTWFRTLDVTWDGLGSEGEAMPFDFHHVRVWVGQGSDMTLPTTEPMYATQFDPDETAPQFVGTLGASGTWNVPDLPIGVGWYACLQSVDYTGNPSVRSDVAGPVTAEQLVSQDLIDDIIDATKLGPDSVESAHIVNGAITTAKILDANIVTAKIADAAINNAKISDLSAGKITAGTMTATVTVTGSLWTSTDTNATRLGFSSAGLQLYKTNAPSGGSTLIGEWRTSDGAMLVTGTFRSALSGERIHIDPDGTFRIYPTSGTNYSQISNVSGEAIWRGPVDGSGRSGRVNVNTLGVGLNFSAESEVPNDLRSEVVLFDRRIRLRAPLVAFEVDETYSSPSGDRRIQFAFVNSSGTIINRSAISYFTDPSTDAGGFIGNDSGWKLDLNGNGDGRFMVTNGTMTGFGVAQATAWDGPSSQELKEEIEDARALVDPLETIAAARARKFKFIDRGSDDRTYVGVIAEELPPALQRPMTLPGGGETVGADLNSLIGVLWGAFGQLIEQEVRNVTGRALVPRKIPAYDEGDTVDVVVPWDETPLEVPSDVTAVALASMPTAMGRVRARVLPGSATLAGCTVRLVFSGRAAITDNLPLAVEAVGRYVWTPPYIPPEET